MNSFSKKHRDVLHSHLNTNSIIHFCAEQFFLPLNNITHHKHAYFTVNPSFFLKKSNFSELQTTTFLQHQCFHDRHCVTVQQFLQNSNFFQ